MTKRENWLRQLRNDNPGWIAEPWEAFKGNYFGNKFVVDPIQTVSKGEQVEGEFLDQWNVTWRLVEGHKVATPFITEDNKAITDIKKWKEQLVLPPLDGHDWSSAIEAAESVDRNEYLVGCMLVSGLFERTHYLMGFQDALINYMIEPDLMYDLLGAIAEWKIEHVRQVIENIKPDMILFHDDWGNKDNLFMQPDVWRQVIKPHQKKIVDFVKSKGVIYLHHSDGICEPIVDDMLEMGMDGWQGIIPQDNIPAIQEKVRGKMALIGGIDAPVIDKPEVDEDAIRTEVRRCVDSYCSKGGFIPCIPNVFPMYLDVSKIYQDELNTYGKDFFKD